ncbi:hypothetical protein [Staphylococcus sp. IVB6227]|nr:hypothetical protein [Staphylococcus sp. IVB6227]UXR77886.1 hypothetical protein MUA92_08590 [Staphylococcus sp. IVB6227]
MMTNIVISSSFEMQGQKMIVYKENLRNNIQRYRFPGFYSQHAMMWFV